jgi:two-component system, LytTR family, response regulator
MHPFKILIVDDEWLIRSELRDLLTQYHNIRVVGEAGSVDDAERLIDDIKPDVVFLDIQMPGKSGFELLDRRGRTFQVVFISAFNQYMEAAQKYNPVDYLLKPISKPQLAQVIQKLLRHAPDPGLRIPDA